MFSLTKYVYFKVESLKEERENRALRSTGWIAGSFLEWTVYQIRPSRKMPQLHRKAEHASSFKKL